MKKLNNKSSIGVFTVIVTIVFFTLLSLSRFNGPLSAISLLNPKNIIAGSEQGLNRIINGLTADKKVPMSHEAQEKSSKKQLSCFLIYLSSVLIVSSDKSLLLLLILFIGFAAYVIRKSLRKELQRRISRPPDIAFYKWWSLKFLTPLQKFMSVRADIIDHNPISSWGTGIFYALKRNPHFVSKLQNAGFFYAYTGVFGVYRS